MIDIKNVSKRYFGNRNAVKDLNFQIEEGEIFCLLGPSGCGKTTTLRLIAGFERPDEGSITIAGKKVVGDGVFVPPEKRNVGMVFQDYALFPNLKVADNILFGTNLTGKERKRRLEEILCLVGLTEEQFKYPHELSGGQQQRVALARALAPRPPVILLDEPLSNLDADLRIRMRVEIKKIIKESGITALMVTHDQEESFNMADRIAVLNKGTIEQIGTPEKIYHQPVSYFVADFVGKADFVKGSFNGQGIESEIGFFPVDLPLSLNEPVEIMIRPDDIHLKIDPAGRGLIIEKNFYGSYYLFKIKLPSGQEINSTVLSNKEPENRLSAGDKVEILANPSHLVIFRPSKSEFLPISKDAVVG